MKKGFTLAELLITVGVIGVVAAIVLPGINNSMPDQNKMKFMKSYSVLKQNLSDIITDDSLYVDNVDGCIGLGCPAFPSIGLNGFTEATWSSDFIRSTKFPRLLASRLNLQSDIVCNAVIGNAGASECTFTTKDGVTWRFTSTLTRDFLNPTETHISTDLTLDVDPAVGSIGVLNTIQQNRNPDQFQLRINESGTIRAVDRLSEAYLSSSAKETNPKVVKRRIYSELNSKKDD